MEWILILKSESTSGMLLKSSISSMDATPKICPRSSGLISSLRKNVSYFPLSIKKALSLSSAIFYTDGEELGSIVTSFS